MVIVFDCDGQSFGKLLESEYYHRKKNVFFLLSLSMLYTECVFLLYISVSLSDFFAVEQKVRI